MRGGRLVVVLYFCAIGLAAGQGSLKTTPRPSPPGLDRYVRDPRMLAVLGKALFWDMQVGSDGVTACATCHFHAGADHRRTNQLSGAPANHLLVSADFPFRVFADPNDNRSAILSDSAQRAGSAGVFRRAFLGLSTTAAESAVDLFDTPAFSVAGRNTRQVTPRNTPSVINAIFNVRNFRDGRASDIFTGQTPFGESDPRPNLAVVLNGASTFEPVRLANSSLASVAVGPPVNTTEMSYEGRTWAMIAKKLLPLRPLDGQPIAPDDSVLGEFTEGRGFATRYTYRTLVEAAFEPAYWNSPAAEYNFPFFFGVAIQAYLTTLVSDDTPFDRFLDGERDLFTPAQLDGFFLFQGEGMCLFCHSGAETTNASFSAQARQGRLDTVLTHALAQLPADTGFFITGVRPASEDPGLDAADDFGFPFSLAARDATGPIAIRGAFKVPGLRNVELTGPYFRNGGQATLEQVVAFYSRGGDLPELPASRLKSTIFR